MSKKTKYLIIGLVVILFGLFINSLPNPTPTKPVAKSPAPQNTAKLTKPTLTPLPTFTYDSNGFPMNYAKVNVSDIAKTPSDYNGKTIMFNCNIVAFAKNSSGDTAAINCADPNDITSIVQIDTTNFNLHKMNQGDNINIYGMGEGSATGKNAFGTDVSEGIVMGLYINDLTSGYSNSQ